MLLAVNQLPGAILSGVPAAAVGIVFFKPSRQVISMSDVEFPCLEAFEYIDVIHYDAFFKIS